MEAVGSDSNSVKSAAPSSTPTSLKSPNFAGKRQVGFTRPTLIIPPPQGERRGPATAGTTFSSQRSSRVLEDRKASVFMFDQFKSGLGFGEKCAYWLYNKLRVWSRKWFTHMFLSIVLILYTIGGAFLFQVIEGQNEKVVLEDLRALRNNLIRGLRNLSIVMPQETSVPEWEGEAARRMREYEIQIISWYQTNKLIMTNTAGIKWTFWNAIVYCGTIYTSIVSEVATVPKQFRPEVEQFVRRRKQQRQTYSTKIVEILDPKTSNVVATKAIIKPNFHLIELIAVLRTFTVRELLTHFRLFKIDMKDECKRIKSLRNRCFVELLIVMIFCGLGGFLFKFIEGSFENFYKCGVKRVKRDFIDLLWIKSHNLREDDWKSLARNRLRTFEEELHTAHEAGVKTYSGQRSWSFLNAVVYCLTIVTTIGYGHIYPETKTGKALTIVYAIIGMPLFLLALTDFGKLFTRCIKFLWSFVRRLYYTGSCRSVRKTAHVQDIFKGAQMMYEIATFRRPSIYVDAENANQEVGEGATTTTIGEDTPTTPAISNFEIDDEFNLPISLAIFILCLYILFGGLIYCVWEGWHFFDSFYFVFISMSTIGFGDVVPDDAACMIVSIVYMVFGLALMSMCINVVQVKLSDTFKQASSKIGATIGISVAEDDGSITIVAPENIEIPKIHEAGISQNQSPTDESVKGI